MSGVIERFSARSLMVRALAALALSGGLDSTAEAAPLLVADLQFASDHERLSPAQAVMPGLPGAHDFERLSASFDSSVTGASQTLDSLVNGAAAGGDALRSFASSMTAFDSVGFQPAPRTATIPFFDLELDERALAAAIAAMVLGIVGIGARMAK